MSGKASVLLVALAIGVAGCGGKAAGESKGDAIKVGVTVEKTGPFPSLGKRSTASRQPRAT